MKIISPNIIATHLFARELRKGVYVYNKKNDRLGRSGQPYGKTDLQNAIKDLDEEITHLEVDIDNWKTNKESWKEVLKTIEEGTEKYKEIEEELEKLDIYINSGKVEIDEKRKIQEKYKKQLEKLTQKHSKEREYLTLKELQNKYHGERFGPNDYPRTFTAAEQNQDRED